MKREEIVKKSLLVGVGLAAFAKEKSEKLVKDLIKKGHLNPQEGKKLVKNIYTEAELSGKKIASVLEKELIKWIKVVSEQAMKKTVKKPKAKKKAPAKKKPVKKKKR